MENKSKKELMLDNQFLSLVLGTDGPTTKMQTYLRSSDRDKIARIRSAMSYIRVGKESFSVGSNSDIMRCGIALIYHCLYPGETEEGLVVFTQKGN